MQMMTDVLGRELFVVGIIGGLKSNEEKKKKVLYVHILNAIYE